MTQKEMVLDHLKNFHGITPLKALEEYGSLRLSAIIHELRHKDGYNIATNYITRKNRFGKSVTFAEYTLEDKT